MGLVALAGMRDLVDWEVDDRPLVAALERLGVRVEQPAWDDATVDWSRFAGCLIRTTWDYHQRVDAFVRWASDGGHRRLFNPAPVIRWNADKRYLRELEQQGVACIPTRWFDAAGGGDRPGHDAWIDEALAATGWERAFLKPVVGANAAHTLRFDATDASARETAVAHLATLSQVGGGMLQPYLASVESYGEVSAIFVDGTFCHGVRKVPVAGDYRVQDDHGASDEPWVPSPAERDIARDVVRAAEAVLGEDAVGAEGLLYARVDFLRGDDGELLLTELELIEPSLFFRHGTETATALAEAVLLRCGHP